MTQILDRMQIKLDGPAGKFEVDSNQKGTLGSDRGDLGVRPS
jgi:hypothetical protein